MTPAGILFDLDGTLLDTAPEFTYCLNLLLEQEGKPLIQVQQLRSVVSLGAKGMIEFAFAICEKDPQFTHLKQRLLDLYCQNIGSLTNFFPGITSILQLIMEQKIRWGIVTNKPEVYTLLLLEKFKPLIEAHCVVAGDTLPTQKPDPAPLLHACQKLGVSPNQCWYIGDAQTDLLAGRRAGMRCAIANYGYIPKDQDPFTWQADCHLITAEDIAPLLQCNVA